MTSYFCGEHFSNITFLKDQLKFQEFENCRFTGCNFSDCLFSGLIFIDCVFEECNFNSTVIAHTSFRTVNFETCTIKDVNFSMCDRLIFEVHFNNCKLDFSKFYGMKLNASSFTECSLIAADFMGTKLTGIVFDKCDFYRAEFANANLTAANLSTSRNYSIDPEKTKIRKAVFSIENVSGLLYKHDLQIEQ